MYVMMDDGGNGLEGRTRNFLFILASLGNFGASGLSIGSENAERVEPRPASYLTHSRYHVHSPLGL